MFPRLKGRIRPTIIAVSVAVLALSWGLSRQPAWVESYHAAGLADAISRVLSTISGWVPGSLAEILALALVIVAGVAAIRSIRSVRRGARSPWSVIGGGLLNATTALLMLSASFYVLWGLNYYRPALASRLGWNEAREATRDGEEAGRELEAWARTLVVATNHAYATAHGTDRAGSPRAPISMTAIDVAIESGYRRLADELDVPQWAARRGRAKPLRISPLLSRLNIGGIYLPWTSEAGFNAMLPDSDLPHTIAHEKAHQRGLAGEDEASFIGFLAALRSGEPYVRYSGLLYAQRRLLTELYRSDPDLAEALVAERSPGVQDDVDVMHAFWSRFRGPLRTTGTRMNDTYLKLHGVEEGVGSYSLSTRLILLWFRNEGGRLER